MKSQFDGSETDLLESAEDLFAARRGVRELRETQSEHPPAATAVEIHAYINRAHPGIDEKVQRAIRFNARIRHLYHQALRTRAVAYLPVRAAAAGDGAKVRRTADAEIEIKPSEARPNRVYVIIRLRDPGQRPQSLNVVVPADHPRMETFDAIPPIALPDPVDSGYQLVCQAGEPLLEALMDHQVELCFV